MYSEAELEDAVAAGAISAESAEALRSHVERARKIQREDQENFRLVTSFNDIFVTIAAVLLLIAANALGGALLSAIVAWALAEYFTRIKHMALPSIILVFAFVGGVAGTVGGLLNLDAAGSGTTGALLFAATAAITALGAYAHWRRFQVPITIAALTAAGGATVIALIAAALPSSETLIMWLVFIAGLAVFAFAMRWDMSDLERKTRRSDVAFWLHLLAAPAIAHPIFYQLGVFDGEIAPVTALMVLALYILFALVALAIDRRAILVSGLAYVLTAVVQLVRMTGSVETDIAFTTLIIGSALLLLSAFWNPIRRRVVGGLPQGWRAKLPASEAVAA